RHVALATGHVCGDQDIARAETPHCPVTDLNVPEREHQALRLRLVSTVQGTSSLARHPQQVILAAGTTTRSGADSSRAVRRPPRGSPSEEAVRDIRPRQPWLPGPTESRCPACDRAWTPPRKPKTASDSRQRDSTRSPSVSRGSSRR